jgi:hypothetical protein
MKVTQKTTVNAIDPAAANAGIKKVLFFSEGEVGITVVRGYDARAGRFMSRRKVTDMPGVGCDVIGCHSGDEQLLVGLRLSCHSPPGLLLVTTPQFAMGSCFLRLNNCLSVIPCPMIFPRCSTPISTSILADRLYMHSERPNWPIPDLNACVTLMVPIGVVHSAMLINWICTNQRAHAIQALHGSA